MGDAIAQQLAGLTAKDARAPLDEQLDAAERLERRLLAAAVRAAQGGSGAAAAAAGAAAGGGGGGPDANLPLQVAAHYLRTLAEWIATQILSKAAAQQKAKGAAAAEHNAAARRHPREEPRAWALLAHALEAGAPLLQGAAVASPGLSAAAAAACEAAAGWRDAARAAALADALLRTLRVLGQQYGLSYRPTLEQQTALLGAVLTALLALGDGPQTAAAWRALAQAQLDGLRATAQAHPAPRKMFSAVVSGSLLPQLLAVAFTRDAAGSGGGGSRWRYGAAAEAAQHALSAVLFHPAHMAGLCEASRAAASTAQAAAAAADGPDVEPAAAAPEAGAADPGAAKAKGKKAAADDSTAPATATDPAAGQQQYHSTLLRRAAALLAGGLGPPTCTKAAAGAGSKQRQPQQQQHPTAAEPLLHGLPILLREYCAAVRRHRRLLETDADFAAAALGRTGGEGSQPGGEKLAEGGGRGALAQLRSAEMDFATALLALLTPYLDPRGPRAPAAADEAEGASGGRKRRRGGSAQGGGGGAAAAPAGAGAGTPSPGAWCAAARGAAGVLEAARTTGAYAPTEDAGGRQRAFLGAVAGAVVGAYSQLASGGGGGGGGAEDGSGGGGRGDDDVEGAAAAVVCAMLDLEHRALQAHAGDMYGLIWAVAAQERRRAAPALDAVAAAAAAAGPGAAARVVSGLVRAAGELRQLDTALAALARAAAAHAAGANGAGADAICVLAQGGVLAAVRAAVGEAPPGQAPALVAVVGSCLLALLALAAPTAAAPPAERPKKPRRGPEQAAASPLGGAAGGEPPAAAALAPLGELLAACLDGLRLGLTVSGPTAAAVRRLVEGPLGPALAAELEGSGGGGAAARPRLLRLLLRLYASAVRLHAACCTLNPEVPPLRGQAVSGGYGASSADADADDGAPEDSYFAAAAATAIAAATATAAATAAAAPPSAAAFAEGALAALETRRHAAREELAEAALWCCMQRLQLLNERWLRLGHTCGVMTVSQAKRAKRRAALAGGRAGAAAQQEAQHRQGGAAGDKEQQQQQQLEEEGAEEGEEEEERQQRETEERQRKQQMQRLEAEARRLCGVLLAPIAGLAAEAPSDGAAPGAAALRAVAAQRSAAARLAPGCAALLARTLHVWSGHCSCEQLRPWLSLLVAAAAAPDLDSSGSGGGSGDGAAAALGAAARQLLSCRESFEAPALRAGWARALAAETAPLVSELTAQAGGGGGAAAAPKARAKKGTRGSAAGDAAGAASDALSQALSVVADGAAGHAAPSSAWRFVSQHVLLRQLPAYSAAAAEGALVYASATSPCAAGDGGSAAAARLLRLLGLWLQAPPGCFEAEHRLVGSAAAAAIAAAAADAALRACAQTAEGGAGGAHAVGACLAAALELLARLGGLPSLLHGAAADRSQIAEWLAACAHLGTAAGGPLAAAAAGAAACNIMAAVGGGDGALVAAARQALAGCEAAAIQTPSSSKRRRAGGGDAAGLLRAAVLARAALAAAGGGGDAAPAAAALVAQCARTLTGLCGSLTAAGDAEAAARAADDGAWQLRALAAGHLFGGLAAYLQGRRQQPQQQQAAGQARADGAALDAAALPDLLGAAAALLSQLPARAPALAAPAGLPALAFFGAAALAAASEDAGFAAALEAYTSLFQRLGPAPPRPQLPPSHWELPDIAAAAFFAPSDPLLAAPEGSPLARLLPLPQGPPASGPNAAAAPAAAGAGVDAREGAAPLQQGLLVAFRGFVAAARRSQLLELHRALERRLAAGAAAGPRELGGTLQALLVVLEASHGGQALRQLAHHAPAYASTLATAVARSAAEPAFAAGGRTAAPAAPSEAAAAVSWALRCLESIAGREGAFQLEAATVACAAAAASDVLAAAGDAADAGADAAATAAAAAPAGAALSLLASLLRHRARDTRRQMAPVVRGARGALRLVAGWLRRPPAGAAARAGWWRAAAVGCAEQLGRVYATVADQKALLGPYCHVLLTDYVITAAVLQSGQPAADASWDAPQQPEPACARASEARADAAAALRRGAHALFGAVAAAELQHLHAVVGQGPAGVARRAALAELRASHEREFKYSGKT
ncbi:hypothetical protein Rsub_00277 [Raphidocelis subcapitata]|uniref:Uncharacterized protein n=1 Tax=Raphidocelis subcapitata TaxID=307507 RepID=A0A2V0NJX6_9CHLO|nr:hypothetical protein Rsub_00277 [Raphidocelis subcapitata]|eukprot:GBF87566.1 hypothetical protein Rsub_00277 [Raphidocelis subcapitata]